jgi:hypothetical protein
LLHWAGRAERRSWKASERPDTAWFAVPGAATGDDVLRAI